MICADFKIKPCPSCFSGFTHLCVMIEYRRIFGYLKQKHIRDLYVECLNLRYNDGTSPAYWIEQAIKHFFPQHQETIDKLRILM